MPPNIVDNKTADGQEPKSRVPDSPTKHHHHHAHRIFKVYVTGFGSFEKVDVNASYLVASTLPSVLDGKYVSHVDTSVKNLQVSIIPHFEPVTVSYSNVEKLIPTLYEDLPGVDLFVHIGVAPFEHYQIETRGRRGPYGPPEDRPDGRKDVDGEWPDGHSAENAARGKVPKEVHEIVSSLDVQGICDYLAGAKRDAEDNFDAPQLSTDAGLYLCEYILYNSMAESIYDAEYESEYPESKPVTNPSSDPPSTSRAIFIHIPVNHDDESLNRSRETVKRIIGAIAVQRVSA
ncbi:hypothetical protein ABW20_dc0108600 [Dactylellina cionopaga]|nr:hypothetical protein ABW20_dc0108600 [Dactylellina cionopaga]